MAAEERDESAEENNKSKTKWDLLIALIPQIPKLLNLVCVLIIVAWFYEPIRTFLVANVTKVEIFGVTAEFNKEQFERIVIATAPDRDFEQIFRSVNIRLRHALPLVANGKILWLDDNHPTQNALEREVVRSLGVGIDIAKTDKEAMDLLSQRVPREQHIERYGSEKGFVPLRQYDLIISDNTRPYPNGVDNSHGGEEFFAKAVRDYPDVKSILYSRTYTPAGLVPNYIFGYTNRYDELLHLILDALERRGTVAETVDPNQNSLE